jgi:hypothetical protein
MMLSPAELREIGQLRRDNHALWKYLQRRVLDPVPVAKIADELGLDVDALVAWMLSYTGPKRKPYQSKHGSPIGKVGPHMPAPLVKEPLRAGVSNAPHG